MEIKDLAGLSEPLKRLIEITASGVGQFFSSYLLKKRADAKAYEIKAIAAAIDDASVKHSLPVSYRNEEIEITTIREHLENPEDEANIEERMLARKQFQETRRQENIERITQSAAMNLSDSYSIPEEYPDDDWISRFFCYAQDISTTEMQELWGRILSGEIIKPGSYSLRTLDAVRNLSKSDAEIFEKMAKSSLKSNSIWFVPSFDKKYLEEKYEIYQSMHFILSEIGFMYPTELSMKMFMNGITQQPLVTEKNILLINKHEYPNELRIPIWKYTQIGSEIISLIDKPNDEEYYAKIAAYFKNKKCEVIFGEILQLLPDGKINYREIRKM